MRMSEIWDSAFRIVVGLYWLYFASQKWQGVGWMRDLIIGTAKANPIPGLRDFLTSVVVPNWLLFAVGQAVGETVVAVLLIIGLRTRWAAILRALLPAHPGLTGAFPVKDGGFRLPFYLRPLPP